MNQKFPKEVRIRKQADFDSIYRHAIHAADNVLVIQGQRNGLNVTRLGLSVSRKVGNAVVRNRWKRVIREVFRKSYNQFPTGIDLIVRPRKGAELSYAEIDKSLPKLVQRIVRKLPLDKTQ